MGFAAGINFYAYVGNNPVNGNDPSGHLGEGVVAKLMEKGIEGATKLFSRATWRLDTLRKVWNKAEPGPNGGKLCSTCEREVTVSPGSGPRDWHGDHYPEKWGDVVNRKVDEALQGNVPTRAEIRELFNDAGNVRLRCADCNVRDNQLGAIAVAGVAGLTATGEAEASSSGWRLPTWREVGDAIFDFIFSPGSANAPTTDPFQPASVLSPQSYLGASSGANGGFLIYPNKSNLNMIRSVYSK